MNDFTPGQSEAWDRSFWCLIKLFGIVTRNKQGDPPPPSPPCLAEFLFRSLAPT